MKQNRTGGSAGFFHMSGNFLFFHQDNNFFHRAPGGVFTFLVLLCVVSCSGLFEELDDVLATSHAITYNLNGGNWRAEYTAAATYKTDRDVMLPSAGNIERAGYTFAGWYDTKELSGAALPGWQAGEKKADVVLWAKWISAEKTLSSFMFTAGANKALAADITGTIDETAHVITVSVPYGTAVSALKASYAAAGTAAVTVGGVIQTSGETVNDFTNPIVYTVTAADGSARNYTVTVSVRAADEYGISYNLNGGNWNADYTVPAEYTVADAVMLPAVGNVVRAGYTFAGWYDTEALTGTAVTGWQAGEKKADVELWAKWTANEYTVVLDSQNATTAGIANVTATYNAGLPAITPPVKTGYTFGGYWTGLMGSGTQYYTAAGTGAQIWKEIALTTLYAKWTANEYTVALDGQGAASAETTTVTTVYDAALPAITLPTKEGYIFGGYWTEVNGGGTQYFTADGAGVGTWQETEVATLYAKWKSGIAVSADTVDIISKLAAADSPHTVVLTGNWNANDIMSVNTALANAGTKIALDMSICTGLNALPAGMFTGCDKLTSVILPGCIMAIANNVFYDCVELISVDIPASVTSIGDYAFQSCRALSAVTIPDNVTSIGNYAFGGCKTLLAISIPNKVTTIGNAAFRGCQQMTTVTIPASVTVIGKGAFDDCKALTSLIFNDPNGWYRTTSEDDWKNKTNGTLYDVANPIENAEQFKSEFEEYYWYKLTD